MKINLVKPSCKIIFSTPNPIQFIERCGRICYKSEDKITDDSADRFVEKLIKSGHHSVLEHVIISCHIICDRGVSHELVRHRLASFSQESTRYCNYKDEMTFVIPPWFELTKQDTFYLSNTTADASDWGLPLAQAANSYEKLLTAGQTPQQARAVLPNSLKTELIMTTNLREWRHIYQLRSSKAAHPQMRELMELFRQEVAQNTDLYKLFYDLFEERRG